MTAPTVSILMAVYNTAQYLKESVESILQQTFEDFEFIIVDDGSTDHSMEIIQTYQDDKRVKLFTNSKNEGLVYSLNYGLSRCKGKYIARMDGDDIAYPDRLALQVQFMEDHPECIVCGAWVKLVGRENVIWKYAKDSIDIKIALMKNSHFAHPLAMIRRSTLVEHDLIYDEKLIIAQDYDLWVQLISIGEFHNMPQVLLDYRVHGNQLTSKKIQVEEEADLVRKRYLQGLGVKFTQEEFIIHKSILNNYYLLNVTFILEASIWLNKLLGANEKTKFLDHFSFRKYLQKKWFGLTLGSTRLGLKFWLIFKNNPLSEFEKMPIKTRIKFFVKCLIKR